ncbi:MAG TPA: amidohydrolase family protein [Terriglobales bacterium]|jgi:imidazolonepropionase-like amidohydrolase|nr:amidohydrolase family protein [Terriglobales bacterium]
MRHIVSVVCLLVALSTMGLAEDKPVPPKVTLIKAGRLLDVREGTYRADQGVLIEGERIKEVGPLAAVQAHAPRDTAIIDLSRSTVLPGLIDCHDHVLGNPKDYSPMRDLRNSSATGAVWGVHNLESWLEHGFTGLRDACESDPGYAQLALRDGIRRGLIRGPRMASAGRCISVTGGHGDSDVLAPDQTLPRRTNLADDVTQIPTAVRYDIKYGADWIKLMATGGVGDPMSDFNRQELSQEQMAKAVEVAHRAGKHVMAHAEGTEGIKAAVRAGVDSIEHGTMLDEEGARLMAEKGTWLVPTLYTFQHSLELGTTHGQEAVTLEKTKAIMKSQPGAFALALKYHLKIAYGLDDDPEGLPREFEALVRGGMSPLEAIRAATVNAAALLGWQDQTGAIEAGKFADVIAVDGDPLKDIGELGRVRFVMANGVVVKGLSP